jgi:clorobiocin biosynthesis protein CloN6
MSGDATGWSLPALKADLVLLHAPALFDFRERRDVWFPFLSTTGDVPITPLYDYYPVGFRSLRRYLGERGRKVEIVNLATLLLRHRKADLAALAAALDVKAIGIDLHWLHHAQGALALAEALKRLRPDLPIVFGGISATWYAAELVRYPAVDLVLRGYDTHAPLEALLAALEAGGDLSRVPNLLWKGRDGAVHDNGLTHRPGSFGCGVDWRSVPGAGEASLLQVRELLSNQTSGCAHSCGWCGGSQEAFQRIYGGQAGMAHKPLEEVGFEFATMRAADRPGTFHVHASGAYNAEGARLDHLLEQVAAAGLKSVNYEQFHLTPDDVLRRMARGNARTTITLSPQSHDLRISRLAGRGSYGNEDLEDWIDRALGLGIWRVEIWYFVGMPEQDERSVRQTVEACERLLERYGRRGASPMICPLLPILDPGSTFFTEPEAHGYRIFHRSLEAHRRAAERASLVNRLNYETRWLSRRQIVEVGFRAVRALMQAKARAGLFSQPRVDQFNARLDDALDFLPVVTEADDLADPAERRRALEALGGEIERRNAQVLYDGVIGQTHPIKRPVGGRWFDDLGWDEADLARAFPD